LQIYNAVIFSPRGEIGGCGPTGGKNQYFTFDAWTEFTRLSFNNSQGAKLLIGLPASVDAADRDDLNTPFYCESYIKNLKLLK
jgi:hypothetical protein